MKNGATPSRGPTRVEDVAELELMINELAADQAATRIVLQSLLVRMFALRRETALAALAELDDHVCRSIEAIPLAPGDQVGAARWRKLVAGCAQKLIGEISDALDLPPARRATRR